MNAERTQELEKKISSLLPFNIDAGTDYEEAFLRMIIYMLEEIKSLKEKMK